MVDSKLNPAAPIFTPKNPSASQNLAYMSDEMIFTNKTLFECILGKQHEYTPSQLVEIDDFIAHGCADGFFRDEGRPGVYRASWEHLILRARKEKEDLKSRPVKSDRMMETMGGARSKRDGDAEEQ